MTVYVAIAALATVALNYVLDAVAREWELPLSIDFMKGSTNVALTAAFLYILRRRADRATDAAFDAAETEVAARRLVEADHGRANAILKSTDDTVISKTLEGAITSWNPAAERLFGYPAAEALGRSIDMLIPRDRAEEERMILNRIRAGERIESFETVRVRNDGALIPVSITFSPTWGLDERDPGADAKIVGVSMVIRDISERKKTEATSEREQHFANSLIEAMPGIFYLYNQQGQFLRWNHNFETISGYTAAEIGKMHPLQFFAEGDRKLIQQRIADVFETGESSVEASLLSRDGTSIPYFLTGKSIAFDDTLCLGGVGVDITERKRAVTALAKSEERYRTTLDNMLESCQLIDFELRYLYLNGAAEVQNRRPNAELLGQKMSDVWPGIEGTPVFALIERCLRERVALHKEIEFTFVDGSTGWLDVRAQAVREGIFILSLDISERKQAEQVLRGLNDLLELKVKERTIDLDAARVRAEAADRIKSAFLATMSHELRTPLNSIIGFAGIILQGLAGPLNPEQHKQLGMVQGSARHLLALINDVLDISKIEAEQLSVHFAPFDLKEAINRVVASVTPLADKKALALRAVLPDQPTTMISDHRRVEQVLLNLLNNGIKFTDRGEVTIAVQIVDGPSPSGGAGDNAPIVRIQVTDTGAGMKEQDLPTLFQPFRQIDSGLQRQHEGTGLGLAISRRLTELLGGTIGVESVWGQGSVFTVALPLHPRGAVQ